MPLLMLLRRLDVERQQLERGHVRVLHLREPHVPLLGEPADDVTGEDQEPCPRHEHQQRTGIQAGKHIVEALHRLIEEDQGYHEQRGRDREPPAAVESRENDREIVEAQEGELLVDDRVDEDHRADEQQHEYALEMAIQEQLGPLHQGAMDHARPRSIVVGGAAS